MKEKNYLRDSLYIGQVYKNSCLIRNSNGLIDLPFGGETRNILFQPSQNLFGVDLLNPHVTLYPILNFSNDEACFTSSFIVNQACSIDDYLSKCGFAKNLTKKDLKLIEKYFLLLRRIRLYHKKVTLLDLKKFHKINSYAIYKDALFMPENISRVLQVTSSFRPLKSEKISLW